MGEGRANISDAELLESLDPASRDLAAIQQSLASRALFAGEGELLRPRDEVMQWLESRADEVLTQAERILRHEITGWGSVTIQHGPVVDFNANYGKSGKYGFHYWTWARPIVQAFLLTADQKYLAEFDALFNQWYEQRDNVTGDWPGLHPIDYELGLGLRNRVFLEAFSLPFAGGTAQTHQRILKTLLAAARWLHEEESKSYRPGNWQMMGSFGLAQIGLMVPQFKESSDWVRLGTQRILEHLDKDFYPDGCHWERCPASYSLVAYRDAHNLAVLHPSIHIGAHLDRIRDFFRHVVAPDGYVPGINDGWRVHLPFPYQPSTSSAHFPASGFTIMRSPTMYMLINHGPAGGGHSHADSLSFELHAFGQPIAIDSGIGDTYDDPHHLRWYVHSRAHNMITIDGDDLDRPVAEGKDVVWQSTPDHDHFAATHHGYEASKSILHRRHIVFVKSDYFLIYDVIDARRATSPHTIEWHLHRPTPGLHLECTPPWPLTRRREVASVIGIPGYTKPQEQIDWLTFTDRIAPGETKSIAVALVPYRENAPSVRIEQQVEGDFLIHFAGRADRITFTSASVSLQRG